MLLRMLHNAPGFLLPDSNLQFNFNLLNRSAGNHCYVLIMGNLIWWCCGNQRKENFCPVCGEKKWKVDDLEASESLTEILIEMQRHKSCVETYDQKIKELQFGEMSHIREKEITNALSNEPGDLFGSYDEIDLINREEIVRRLFLRKIKMAIGQKEAHEKSRDRYKKWSESFKRHFLNT